jgi:hypothetical protein
MEIKQIDLREINRAIGESPEKPIIILDPQGNSETFFKYKACLLCSDVSRDMQPSRLNSALTGSLLRGDNLVLSLAHDQTPWDYFDDTNFPASVLDIQKFKNEVLPQWEEEGDYLHVKPEFRFIVLYEAVALPDWITAANPSDWTVLEITYN